MVSDASDRTKCILSMSDPSPSISTEFGESSGRYDTLADIDDRSYGVWNVLCTGPT